MRIALLTNPTAHAWSPVEPDSLGGGEEVVVAWARAMARRGHEVTVAKDGPWDNDDSRLLFCPRSNIGPRAPFDVAIYFKCPEAYTPDLAPLSLAWTDQERPADYAAFARVIACSPFLARVLAAQHPHIADRVTVMPHGYEPGDADVADIARDPNLVLYASSPDRGLTTLLRRWPEVVAARPRARLRITYGWDLYRACGGTEALVEEVNALIAACPPILDETVPLDDAGAGIRVRVPTVTHRRADHAEMARLYLQAGVWAYPCTGGEMFCLTAVKAQMAGCVPVVRPWGALHDTVWSGLRADDEDGFVRALIAALDPAEQERLRAGIAPMAPTWDDVAEGWERLLAEPAPVSTTASHLRQVPPTPVHLLPNPAANVPPALQQALSGWAQHARVGRPVVTDPALGLAFPPVDGPPDAVCVGWQCEDHPRPPHELLAELPDGIAVLVLTSTGPWRATSRYRHFGKRDLMEVFGAQPELATTALPLDQTGNAVCATSFRLVKAQLGRRNLDRVRRTAPARESLSVCMIAPPVFADGVILKALRSVQPIADEVIIAINGVGEGGPAVVETADVLERFGRETGIPVRAVVGTSPRFCHDCLKIHDVGDLQPGHRLAGFETPRNQSVAPARGDWCLWLDADEQLCEGERLREYLRDNPFAGYGLNQDHHSSDPPQAFKRDTPVRLFRLARDGNPAGWTEHGPHRWPTFHTGFTARFAGVVHEHPGHGPNYPEGLGPVCMIGDVWLAHSGYFTEPMRRGRFLRNWPLMVADRLKYPERRLGQFLWLRDLSHHIRYGMEQLGRLPPEGIWCAEEAIAVFERSFADRVDPFLAEAMQYVTIAYTVLQRGYEVSAAVSVKRPELTGDHAVVTQFAGRLGKPEHVTALIEAGLAGCEQWSGNFA